MKLTIAQTRDLRRCLLSCKYMNLLGGPQQIMSDMQKNYSEIRFSSNPDPQIEVGGVINTCLSYGGADCLEDFLRILEGYEGTEAIPMKAVWATWREIVTPSRGPAAEEGQTAWKDIVGRAKPGQGPLPGRSKEWQPPKVVTPLPKADVSQEGLSLHWDREHVVTEFVKVVVMGLPRQRDVRALAIPAPAEADPDWLIRRLEKICDKLSQTLGSALPIIHARLQLEDWPEYQIVTEVLKELAGKAPNYKTQLEKVWQQVEKEWPWKGPPNPNPSTANLAKQFSECLAELAKESRIVLLLHRFHNLREEVGQWVKIDWLTSHAPSLEGVVVVLAGASGLDKFSQPPHIVSFELGEMTVRQFWQWAHDGYKLEVTEAEIEELNREHGPLNPQSFHIWLDAKKPTGMDRERPDSE